MQSRNTIPRRLQPEYYDGIRTACKGELIGELCYKDLANRCVHPDQKAKLRAIAAVELLTYQRLQPIAARLEIEVCASDLHLVAQRRANELASLSWRAFLELAIGEWPAYITRFAQLEPPGDQKSIQLLVAHEVTLVQFARLEHQNVGAVESLSVLTAFLENEPTSA